VAIEGPRGEPLAVHAPADRPAAAAATARYLRQPRQVALRVPFPGPAAPAVPAAPSDGARPRAGATARDRSPGALVLLGDDPATDLERAVAARIAPLLALELARVAQEGRGGRTETLPSDGPPWVVLVARQVDPGGGPPVGERDELRGRIRRLAPPRRLALRGDSTSLELRLVAAAPEDDPDATALAARAAEIAARPVVVSRPFSRVEERPLAEAEARSALEAVERLRRRDQVDVEGRVVLAAHLPAYRLLGNLHNIPDGVAQARLLLAPLLVGRPQAQRERLRTLGAVLEQPGATEAASALGVHRNTLAYRLARIERLAGWRLGDPDLRFALALAVRLVQTAQD
jgi:hypothetical protein